MIEEEFHLIEDDKFNSRSDTSFYVIDSDLDNEIKMPGLLTRKNQEKSKKIVILKVS